MDPQLVTLIIALAGGIGSVLSFLAGRRERDAQALSDEGSAAVQISEGYLKLVGALEKRVDSLERENRELCKQMEQLQERRGEENRELKREIKVLQKERDELKKDVRTLEERLGKVEHLTNGHNGG
jgi:peptidoglycan hydrolase CwlO-like protein